MTNSRGAGRGGGRGEMLSTTALVFPHPAFRNPHPALNLLLLLLDRLLDRLDEVSVFLVGGQLGGVGFRVFALWVFVGRHALMGVVKHAPNQPLTNHLGGAAAGLGLGRLGCLGRLDRFFLFLFWSSFAVFVFLVAGFGFSLGFFVFFA